MVIGLFGNRIVVAVISTLRRRGQKTSVQLFLLNSAISDLMVCLCKLARFMQVLLKAILKQHIIKIRV